MKKWLLKWKVSRAFDQSRSASPALQQSIADSKEARLFATDCATLNRELKAQLPVAKVSESQHESIMRAVRNSRVTEVTQAVAWTRWVPVSGLALFVVLAASLTLKYFPYASGKDRDLASISQPLTTAHSAVTKGADLLRQAPTLALSPIAGEMKKLDQDFNNTREFLIASLP